MIRLTLEKLDLQNPTWSSATLKVGEEVTMSVDAPNIAAPQFIRFDIFRAAELIDSVSGKPGKTSQKWTPPNLEALSTVMFRAVLVDKPSPANGHTAVVAGIDSPNATFNSYSVAVNTIDEAFVPKQEQLNFTYTVTDADNAARKGRFEVWGERCPDENAVPIYTEDFTPAAGPQTWTSWSGKANGGKLSGKYITPEFSPYRVRVIIGPDASSVKDPDGAGQGKVAIAETQFEISVFSVLMRIPEKIKNKETAKLKEHKLKEVLAIDPPRADGTYEDDDTGRLPKPAETLRIRMPMARHQARGEDLNQGGNDIGGGYSTGPTKISLDRAYYTRPELPIEFEPRLKSRDNTVNTDPDKRGLFEKEAIGPLKIEPVAEDYFDNTRFPNGALAGNQRYFTLAAFKIKDGTHSQPVNTGAGGNPANSPMYPCWQARLEVAADNTGVCEDFTITTFNGTDDCGYTVGAHELTVYLNRTKLELSDRADDNELDEGKKDYREIDPGGGAPATQIRLAPWLTRQADILWVVRTSAGAVTAPDWKEFPQGPNCHKYYGGTRGIKPTADLSNYFRKQYSLDPGGTLDPIIGKAKSTYRFTDYINLRPALQADQDKQERVEISVRTTGSKRSIGGVLFSPSHICGDTYVLHAWVDHQPYERNFGFVTPKAKIVDSSTGKMVIWRRLQFKKSLRMPLPGTDGLNALVGLNADGGAPHPADGLNMSVTGMNAQYAEAFYEWTVPDSAPVHENVPLKKYRKAHNLHSNGLAGKVPLNANSDVRNNFVQYDYYREQLPPSIPANRQNLATNVVAGQAKGTDSPTVGAAVLNAINLHVAPADAALDPGVAQIPIYGGTPDQYFMAFFGRLKDTIGYPVVDTLTPRDAQPRKMNVVRWNQLHESPLWNNFNGGVVGTTGMSWEGECMGDGNSLLRAGSPSNTLFAHEMGHSTQLAHFVGMNVCWKHHDFNTPGCLMSYTFTRAFIWSPGGAVGTLAAGPFVDPGVEPWPLAYSGTDVEHGWPHWGNNPATAAVNFCIRFGRNLALAGLCAKCILKLCGWDEEKLPAAWAHPDLY
jgi:hypothetical protein